MLVYRPSLPIDYFDGLSPLNAWIVASHVDAGQPPDWTLKATELRRTRGQST